MEAQKPAPRQIFLEKLLKINQSIEKNLVYKAEFEFLTKDHIAEFYKQNDQLKREIQQASLAFYIFGDVSSGKTTFLNGIMCELTSSKIEIFKTHCDENTMGLFFIAQGDKMRVSPDISNPEKVLESLFQPKGLDTSKVFEQDTALADALSSWNDFVLANKKKIKNAPLPKIRVEIPFDPKYRSSIGDISFVDTPGVDVEAQKVDLLNVANNKLSIFVWVLSLVNPKPLRENLKNFMRSLSQNRSVEEFQFWLIVTHADAFTRNYENYNEDDKDNTKIPDFKKKILTITEELLDLNIKVSKITFLRAHEYKGKKGEFTKLKYKQLANDIVKFKTEIYDLYRGAHFIKKLQAIFNEIKATKGRGKTFKYAELKSAKEIFETSFHKFETNISDCVINLKDDAAFISKLNSEIIEAQSYLTNYSTYVIKKTYLKDMYMIKKTYLKDMLNRVIPAITSYMNKKLTQIVEQNCKAVLNNLQFQLGKRVDELFGFLSTSSVVDSDRTAFGILSMIMAGVGGCVYIAAAEASLFIPAYGIFLAGILGTLAAKDYLGMWTYDGCVDEIKKASLEFMEQYLKDARQKSIEEFKTFGENLTNQLENSRQSEDSTEKEVDKEINACKEEIVKKYISELNDTFVLRNGRMNFTEENIREVDDPDLKAHIGESLKSNSPSLIKKSTFVESLSSSKK